jgi:hypothetical protein
MAVSTAHEPDVAKATWLSGPVRHVDEGGGIAKLQSLLGHDLGKLLAAIAGVHAPHAADAVEVALAAGVGDEAPVTLDQDQRPFPLEAVEMSIGMKEVVVILLPQILGVETVAGMLQHHGLQTN